MYARCETLISDRDFNFSKIKHTSRNTFADLLLRTRFTDLVADNRYAHLGSFNSRFFLFHSLLVRRGHFQCSRLWLIISHKIFFWFLSFFSCSLFTLRYLKNMCYIMHVTFIPLVVILSLPICAFCQHQQHYTSNERSENLPTTRLKKKNHLIFSFSFLSPKTNYFLQNFQWWWKRERCLCFYFIHLFFLKRNIFIFYAAFLIIILLSFYFVYLQLKLLQ